MANNPMEKVRQAANRMDEVVQLLTELKAVDLWGNARLYARVDELVLLARFLRSRIKELEVRVEHGG